MTVTVLYEDQDLLIVDKPTGMVVHEGAGNSAETVLLTDWIKTSRPEIVSAFANQPPEPYFRPGIVHRLDKETSGLLVVAKRPAIKAALQDLFKARAVSKEYRALVYGQPNPEEGSIETFIARNPHHRREMAVSFMAKGKLALTEYKMLKIYHKEPAQLCLLAVTLHSGRMHQIRVHLKYKGWPIIGDQTYSTKPSRRISKALGLARQFLHAERLAFIHPENHQQIEIISPLPADLQSVLNSLEPVKKLV